MSLLDCTVIGDIFIDLTITLSDLKEFSHGGTTYCDFAKVELGGSGNVANGLSLLGAKVAFVGKAGEDTFGKLYSLDLKKKNIISKIFFDKDSPTGLTIVFVDNKYERSFLVFRGANDKLSVDDIKQITNLIKRSKFVYVSGYSLSNTQQEEVILQIIEIARRHNAKIIFDPGAYNIVKSRHQFFTKLLDLCDIMSLNLKEAEAITNTSNIESIISKLMRKVPLTALKNGKKGCILISGNEIQKVPGFKVECVDSTGAGDAFTAALIYGLARELPLEAIGKLANWYAAQVVKRQGPRSYPTKSRINHFLRELI